MTWHTGANVNKVKRPSVTNAPKLIKLREGINSQGKGPYAVSSLLGWVVNDPLRNSDGSVVSVNRISPVSPVSPVNRISPEFGGAFDLTV